MTCLSGCGQYVCRTYWIRFSIPNASQWFAVFTCLIILVLAFLGFTNFSHSLPVNDKVLHFVCMGIATAVFYFIFDPEE